MDRNGSLQAGSRIPRFAGKKAETNGYQPEPLPNIGHKPSRLEQMQADYQRNIMRQKEEKLIHLYEENQSKALQRVNQKKGHVREFFDERRGKGPSDQLSPTLDHLYQQKKSASLVSGHSDKSFANGKHSPKYVNQNRQQAQKQSAGRDRSNLLAPINRNGQYQDSDNPFAKRKPQIVRPRTYMPQNKENTRGPNVPQSAPTGDNYHLNGYTSYEDESPPPNPQQLHYLQQKRKMLQSQRSSKSVPSRQPVSRQNGFPRNTPESIRKQNHSRNTYDMDPSDEDEGYADNNSADEEIKKKQQELLAQIEAQQRELERLRTERMQVEKEEEKEKERRRKFEEDRRRKQAEEERKRQKAEEEERMKQQWEEEKQQKMESEKRRMRHVSQNSRVSEQDSHSRMHNDYEDSPTPPPKPRPANTRKSVPKKRAPAKQPTPSPPMPRSDHASLYENAINEEGAFENVGRLAECYNCGRKFAEDRLEKHEQFCKNVTKKRKVMDPAKTRIKGTDQEQYVAHAQRKPEPKKSNPSNWRQQHQSFMETIKYAKKCSQIEKAGGNLADLPPPPKSENLDYVQCPHCTRRFNASAAERHIPHCKNSRAKPPPRRR